MRPAVEFIRVRPRAEHAVGFKLLNFQCDFFGRKLSGYQLNF